MQGHELLNPSGAPKEWQKDNTFFLVTLQVWCDWEASLLQPQQHIFDVDAGDTEEEICNADEDDFWFDADDDDDIWFDGFWFDDDIWFDDFWFDDDDDIWLDDFWFDDDDDIWFDDFWFDNNSFWFEDVVDNTLLE